MEITLEILFWTLVGCSSLIVILQSVSISKKNELHRSLTDESNKLTQAFENNDSLIKALFDAQDLNLKATTQRLSDSIDASHKATDELSRTVTQQGLDILSKQELNSQAMSTYNEQVYNLVTTSTSSLEKNIVEIGETQRVTMTKAFDLMKQQQAAIEQFIAEGIKAIKSDLHTLSSFIDNKHADTLNALSSVENHHMKTIATLTDKQREEFDQIQKLLSFSHHKFSESLLNLKKLNERSEFSHRQSNVAMLEQLTTQIQKLCVDNLVSLTNELAKHQELEIDTEDFVKKLGDCKVTQIEDKHSGQVTYINYDNNIKRRSDTYANERLKYQMLFNEEGKPLIGREFDDKGNIVFEYNYNDAGEVTGRIEKTFDQSGNEISQVEVAY
ncbi:hypothetical protein ATG66_3735 [Vibrio sp. ES.051]|uniref:chemotaxis protein n=1 Tax=Vibrio sp. ES.051 TaxID=1761909 RepID=UPI000BF479F4|nr:chemotaxis protein [Vibrio sp. ES.051]PFG45449.1 hypothetical protein ATG66_3735 [Vibrio sp. ES.051]